MILKLQTVVLQLTFLVCCDASTFTTNYVRVLLTIRISDDLGVGVYRLSAHDWSDVALSSIMLRNRRGIALPRICTQCAFICCTSLIFNETVCYIHSFIHSFLQRAQCSHCKRCISYGNSVRLSVRLSVCPSHAGIDSKRRHVARCSLHRWIAKCV